jgi:hypothetical protein
VSNSRKEKLRIGGEIENGNKEESSSKEEGDQKEKVVVATPPKSPAPRGAFLFWQQSNPV